MEHGHWPVILIEVVLTFGGVLVFAWWQLRSVARDQKQAALDREQKEQDKPAGGESR